MTSQGGKCSFACSSRLIVCHQYLDRPVGDFTPASAPWVSPTPTRHMAAAPSQHSSCMLHGL